MSIEEAILQMIELGEKDPLTIVSKLAHRHGDDWLRAEASAHAHDFGADLARRLLGTGRRSSELALRAGDQVTSAELKLRSYWIPEQGWKRAADLTAEDLTARQGFYMKLAEAALQRAAWLGEVMALMAAEGVKTLGKVKAALPPLPDEGDPLVLGEAS